MFEPLVVESGPPPAWICVYHVQQSGGDWWEIYRAPDRSAWGIAYEAPAANGTVSGRVWVVQDSRSDYSFNDATSSGFVRFESDVASGDEVGIQVYDPTYHSNISALQTATFDRLWTEQEGVAWLLHRTEIDGQNYTFPRFLPEQTRGFWVILGSDFRLTYQTNVHIDSGIEGVITDLPDPDCTSTPVPMTAST